MQKNKVKYRKCDHSHHMRTENLHIGYGTTTVQSALNLSIRPGEMVCLLGRNGCGKSTLMRTLSGLQPALGGEVFLSQGDKEVTLRSLSANEQARMMALVLTERLSLDNTVVHDIVAMGRYPYTNLLGSLSSDDEDKVAVAMMQTGVTGMSNRTFNSLSDGEKQRVLIAKAIAQDTPLILLDEPTAHLDLPGRIQILLLLRQLAHDMQHSIIISTHELDLALQTADTIWLMGDGVITGTPKELVDNGSFTSTFQGNEFKLEAKNGRLNLTLTD